MVTPHVPNQSQRRPRGYGLDSGMVGPLATEANAEHYFTQPGWPMDPRNKHPKRVRIQAPRCVCVLAVFWC